MNSNYQEIPFRKEEFIKRIFSSLIIMIVFALALYAKTLHQYSLIRTLKTAEGAFHAFFFSLGVFVLVLQLLKLSRPNVGLVIDGEGLIIHTTPYRNARLYWNEIESLKANEMQVSLFTKMKALELFLKPESDFMDRQSGFPFTLRRMLHLKPKKVSINVRELDLDLMKLKDLVEIAML